MNLDPNTIHIFRNGEAPKEASLIDEELVLIFPDGVKIIIPKDGFSMDGNLVTILPTKVLLVETGEDPVRVDWDTSKLKTQPPKADQAEEKDNEVIDDGQSAVGQLGDELQWQASWEDSPLPWAPLPEMKVGEETQLEFEAIDSFRTPTLDFRVSDEGLAGALPDGFGLADLTNSVIASGSFNLTIDPSAVSIDILSQNISSGGVTLVWTNDGNQTVIGSANGEPVIVATIDDTGQFTVFQLGPIDHPDQGEDTLPLNFKITIQDGEFTTETKVTVVVEDDSPVVTATSRTVATLTLDESDPGGSDVDGPGTTGGLRSISANFGGNFKTVFGADGEGDSSYGMALKGQNIASGLYTVEDGDYSTRDGDGYGQGSEILLSKAGNTITGSADGVDYFTISVNPETGKVTFTQLENIWHPDGSDSDDVAVLVTNNPGDLQITLSATDGDGDVVTTGINLGRNTFRIEDDGPTGTVVSDQAVVLTLDETRLDGAISRSVTANYADNFSADYGEDGPGATAYGAFKLTLRGDDVSSGLYATQSGDRSTTDGDGYGQGREILMSREGDTITGSVGREDYFTITVDSGTGEVTFTQLEAIWHSNAGDSDDLSSLITDRPGDLRITRVVTDADGDVDTVGVSLGNGAFGIEDDGPTTSVNFSQATTLTLDESTPGGSATSRDFSNNFTTDFGEDGVGADSYEFSLSSNGIESGLYAVDSTATTAYLLRRS